MLRRGTYYRLYKCEDLCMGNFIYLLVDHTNKEISKMCHYLEPEYEGHLCQANSIFACRRTGTQELLKTQFN